MPYFYLLFLGRPLLDFLLDGLNHDGSFFFAVFFLDPLEDLIPFLCLFRVALEEKAFVVTLKGVNLVIFE